MSSKVCISNKTENLHLGVFNLITRIIESNTLTKHISCKCKCKFNGRKCNSNQKRNNNKCWCECESPKKHRVFKKDYILNPATCSCENGKHLASINNGLVITCDEIKDAEAKSNDKET